MIYIIFLNLMYLSYFIHSLRIDLKLKNIIYFINLTFIFWIIGFRGFIGYDWINYYPTFLRIESLNEVIKGNSNCFDILYFEIGYKGYISFIKWIIGTNYNFYIIIDTLTNLIILNAIFNYYFKEKKIFTWIVFFSIVGFNIYSVNLFRNFKPVLLFLFSLRFLEKGKSIKYILINLLGATFHKSSIIFVLVLPLLKIKINKKTIMTIFFISNIVYLLRLNIAIMIGKIMLNLPYVNEYSRYLLRDENNYLNKISIGYFFQILIFMLLINKLHNEKFEQEKFRIIFNVYIISILIFLNFNIGIIIQRLYIMFQVSIWIIYPLIIDLYKKKMPLILLFYIYFNLYTYSYYIRNDFVNFKYVPYTNILLNNVSTYDEKIKK